MKNKLYKLFENKKYVFIILLIVNLLIAFGGYVYFKTRINTRLTNKARELEAIAELKAKVIRDWISERTGDIKISSEVEYIKNLLAKISAANDSKTDKLLQDYFGKIIEHLEYKNVYVSHPTGKVVWSYDKEDTRFDFATIKRIISTATNKKMEISDFYFCPTHKTIHFDFISPVFDKNNNVICLILYRINPETAFYSVIESWPLKTKTAETILLKRDGDSVIILNELRFKKNSALSFRIPAANKKLITVMADSKKSGEFEIVDYRNKEVLAYYTLIPGTEWILVSKIDKEEIFENIYYEQVVIIILVSTLIILTSILIISLYLYRKKNVFKLLWQSEQEFRTVLYSIGDAVITTDVNGIVKLINPVAADLTGWSREEAINRPLKDIFKLENEDTGKEVENPVSKVLEHGIIVGLANHTLLIQKNGNKIPIADSGAPVKNIEGKIIGVVLVFRDQTEERNHQKLLAENEEKYRSLFESTNDGICLHEVLFDKNNKIDDYKIIEINNRYTEILGLKPSDVVGKKASEVYKMKPAPYLEEFCKVGITGESFVFETYFEPMDKYFLISVFAPGINKFATVFQDISQRKRAEKQIIESEKKFRLMYENAPLSYQSLDINACLIDVNPTWLKTFGYDSRDEVLGRPFTEFMTPESAELVKSRFPHFMQAGEVHDYVFEMVKKNGAIFTVSYEGKIGRDELGNFKQTHCIFHDITEQKKAEELKQKSEEQLRTLINSMPDIVCFKDGEGRWLEANDFDLNLFELSGVDYKGKTDAELAEFSPFYKNAFLNCMESDESAWQTGRLVINDEIIPRPYGSSLVFEVIKVPMFNPDGSRKGLIVVGRDITERKRIFEELERYKYHLEEIVEERTAELYNTEESFKKIAESSSDFIIRMNSDYLILYANPAFCTQHSLSQEEIINHSIEEDQIVKQFENVFLQSLSVVKRSSSQIKFDIYENKRWTDWQLIPVLSSNGSLDSIIAFGRDITDRKKLEDNILKALVRERELNEMKSNFLSMASHEYRTPLTSILTNAEILEMFRKDYDDVKIDSILQSIQNSVLSMTELLDEVLLISKTESGKLSYNPTEVNIKSYFGDIYHRFKEKSGADHIVHHNFSAENEDVRIDKKLVTFIIDNLLNNAVKYSKKNTNIWLDVKSDKRELSIVVADEGIGIEADDMGKLFEPFYRSKNVENMSGHGLGLSIVKNCVELHNGYIKVDSKPGEGTKFTVTLQLEAE